MWRYTKVSPDQSILQPHIGLPFTIENTELQPFCFTLILYVPCIVGRISLYNDHYMQ